MDAYDKRHRVLKVASKSQTTAVIRRRSIYEHDPRFRTKHIKRRSYNGRTVEQLATVSIPRCRAAVALHKLRQARNLMQCNTMMYDL